MIKIKINTPQRGFKAGQTIRVEGEKDKPSDEYWRRRLADSSIDNNCEIVVDKKTKSSPKK